MTGLSFPLLFQNLQGDVPDEIPADRGISQWGGST